MKDKDRFFRSLLDNDLYKFCMQQAILQLYPEVYVRYEFINRGINGFAKNLEYSLRGVVNSQAMNCGACVDEIAYLKKTCYFLSSPYIEFLSRYRFNPAEVTIKSQGNDLRIIIEGPWYQAILWEVPLMAAISELNFADKKPEPYPEVRKKAIEKLRIAEEKGFNFADFGTRRRFSFENHDAVIRNLAVSGASENGFIGTSNLHFAKEYNLRPIGTQAHEWFMFHAAKYGYGQANRMALKAWTKVYRGHLGIALADTFTTENFLKSFDCATAKLFDGVRQDSGCPFEFTDKIVKHYKKLRIDPRTKTIVFSDGLNIYKASKIAQYCKDIIQCSFGIGTNLTNDVGVRPLNIVIKMTACKPNKDAEWTPVVKISDDTGKITGNRGEVEYAKTVLKRSW